MHEFSRRTVLGAAAWSAPVVALAVAAPGAAASVDLGVSLAWQSPFSSTASGTATLIVTNSGAAIPASDGTFLLTIAPAASSAGAITLTPSQFGTYWFSTSTPGSSITFIGDGGLPAWITPTQMQFDFALSDAAVPVDLRATLSRNGEVVAVSPTMSIGRPWVSFQRSDYTVEAGGAVEVRGAFNGPSGSHPTDEAGIQVSNSNTVDFLVEPYIADASGFILAAYSLTGAGATTRVSIVQAGYVSQTVTIRSV